MKAQVPRLEAMLAKVVEAYGDRHGETPDRPRGSREACPTGSFILSLAGAGDGGVEPRT